MYSNPFRKLSVNGLLSPHKLIKDSSQLVESWLLRFSQWRDKAIRIENVQNHEIVIYSLQKRLNDADYKLGKARQHRERYNTKKKELEHLTNRFASGQLDQLETAFMLQLQTEFKQEYKNYDPISENLHDDLSVRGCEIRFDRINAELSSSREKYWRSKQESQEKRDDVNRLIAFASVFLSVVLFEPFRLYFNRQAVRFENTKLMTQTREDISAIIQVFQDDNQRHFAALQQDIQKQKSLEMVDSSCQTEEMSVGPSDAQQQPGSENRGATSADEGSSVLKSYYAIGVGVGLGVSAAVLIQSMTRNS